MSVNTTNAPGNGTNLFDLPPSLESYNLIGKCYLFFHNHNIPDLKCLKFSFNGLTPEQADYFANTFWDL
jgi:hypothetical protein